MERVSRSGLEAVVTLVGCVVHIAFGLLVIGLFIKAWIEVSFFVAVVIVGLLSYFVYPVVGVLFPVRILEKKE